MITASTCHYDRKQRKTGGQFAAYLVVNLLHIRVVSLNHIRVVNLRIFSTCGLTATILLTAMRY